MQNHNCSGFGE